ncbi:virion protein G10 [Equid gammaherpesvirus 5]|uniref:Protein G10 n=1 Tax=Equid gammaherpesvirus 5 TaxID=10371 RepID=A0A0B4Q5M8_9GAMA|nr:protein G10 [Equid gammaherpesvirus 5]AIU39538.1 protein G10 [Equid gammaherpesvirus 5]APT43392.1 virion protein G10 [Equid gammaherpesvirus 5]UTK45405.1 protein G10 [Equid gammaherpesvirus 5]UTK45484.1 protein G10 [Equid gammaherpesvirus 5]UTK45563.1 protein G10 [Equid gammaherpesvirus 5]
MEEVVQATLADMLLAMRGEVFYVEDWKIEVTSTGLMVVNTVDLNVQAGRCSALTLPFSVWSLMEILLCRFEPANQLHVACRIFDSTFIMQNMDYDQSKYLVVETVLSDLKKPICCNLITGTDLLTSGELRLSILPLKAIESSSAFSAIYNMFNDLPPGLELGKVTEYCGSRVMEVSGVALRTAPRTYTMAFKWPEGKDFFRITNSQFCEYYNKYRIVHLSLKECKMYRKGEDVYVLDLVVTGDKQPEAVNATVSVLGAHVDPVIVTDRFIAPKFNQAWGWSLPINCPGYVTVPARKTIHLPVKGMFFRGSALTQQRPVCLVGNSNCNPELLVRPVVWEPMTSLVLTLYNNSDSPVTLGHGDLLALAVPVYRTDINTVFSDNAGTLFTWDTCELTE